MPTPSVSSSATRASPPPRGPRPRPGRSAGGAPRRGGARTLTRRRPYAGRSCRSRSRRCRPHPWEASHELGALRRAGRRRARGTRPPRAHHRALGVRARAGASRRALRDGARGPSALLGTATARRRSSSPARCSRPTAAARASPSTSRAPSRSSSALLPLDFVHVHEPFAPSTASAALRHSRALNIGSFHAPTERLLSTQVARRFVELFFGRLDARIASYAATAALMESTSRPTTASSGPWCRRSPRPQREPRAAAHRLHRRGGARALRMFLRALRRLGTNADWEATVLGTPAPPSRAPLRAELRERVRFAAPGEAPAPGRARGGRRRRPRLGRSASRARARARRDRRGRRAARLAARRSTRRCSPTASAACCSSPATSTRSPPSSRASPRDRGLRERLARAADALRAGLTRRAPSTSSRRSTRRSPRVGARRGRRARGGSARGR